MPSASERGFSIIEALVMLAVTALVLSLVLPAVSRGAAFDFRSVVSGNALAAEGRGEAAFRGLIRQAGPAPDAAVPSKLISGDARSLTLYAFLQTPTLCTQRSGWVRVNFWIKDNAHGGELKCRSQGRTETLARWASGSGTFGYKQAAEWRDHFGGDDQLAGAMARAAGGSNGGPVLVRFSVTDEQGKVLIWTESVPAQASAVLVGFIREEDGGGDLDR